MKRPLAFLVLLAALAAPSAVQAQITPIPTPPAVQGTVTGTVKNGTAGATTVDGVRVELITVAGSNVSSQEAPIVDGRFEFSVPATASVTYVLRAVYQGVQYLVDPPVLLSPESPMDDREITVYESTREEPQLTIDTTVVSLRGVDEANGQLGFVREDRIINPTDRVYVGSEGDVTLRIPAPEGVQSVDSGDSIEGQAVLDGATVTITQPIRPGANLVVTRYVVGYDPGSDGYRLRVTAPLPAEHMEVWVPDRLVDSLSPSADAERGSDRDLQDERWLTLVRSSPAAEGEGIIATLEGLSGRNAPNPLTERVGAGIAVALALAALVGGVVLLARFTGALRPGDEVAT